MIFRDHSKITLAFGPPKNRPFLTFLNRRPHEVAPLGPRAVVIADLRVAEQVGQDEPGQAGTLADPAIGDDVVARLEPELALVDGLAAPRPT